MRHGRFLPLALVAALAGALLIVQPAGAAPGAVSGATFEWTFSDEANAAAFNGQCNFWSAGESDGSEAAYVATNGNLTVLKLDASDQYVPISSYASRCLDKNGQPVNTLQPPNAKRLGQKIRFTNGTGTLDPSTGASTIQWTGTWSINFYGDNVPFWIKDPKLTINAGGTGQITADMGGYKSDQANPSLKVPLTPVEDVVIADLTGVAAANTTGFTTTPKYAGVQYDVDPETGQSPQNRTTAGWGSWPASFVDFQMQTGLGSYWYSTGGSIDPRKPPQPLTVSYGSYSAPAPAITVTPNTNLNPSVEQVFSVNGAGFFDFASSPPPGEGGVYVGFVPASKWQPGQTPNAADFVGTQFVPKQAIVNGAFATTVTVPAGTAVDPGETYGIGTICAHGCSVTQRKYDTYAAVNFSFTTDPAQAKVGVPFRYQIPPFTGAVLPVTFAVTGKTPLPAGLTLDASTGVIAGTPAAEVAPRVRVKITDSKSPRAKSKTVTLKFRVAPDNFTFGPDVLPAGSPGAAYPTTTLVASGGIETYKFKVTAGKLPKGMKLSAKGVLSGKPKAAGSYPITITVNDKLKFTAAKNFVVEIGNPAS